MSLIEDLPSEESEERNEVELIYKLSPMQQAMLFHSLYAPDSGVYVIQLSLRLSGLLDVAAFERAWRPPVEGGELVAAFAYDLARLFGLGLFALPPGFGALPAEEALRQLAAEAKRLDLLPVGLEGEELGRRFAVFEANFRAMERYAGAPARSRWSCSGRRRGPKPRPSPRTSAGVGSWAGRSRSTPFLAITMHCWRGCKPSLWRHSGAGPATGWRPRRTRRSRRRRRSGF